MRKPGKSQNGKPDKPSAGYPLWAHQSGYWCKKNRGKHYYFGKWSDPDAALAEYEAVKDYLKRGESPPADLDVDSYDVKDA